MLANNLLAAAGAVAPDFNGIQSKAGAGSLPSDIGSLFTTILPYVFGLAGILLLIYLVMGGLQLMTSQGDPKAAQSAQGKITNSLIGFIIVIIAASLVALLGQMLNVDIFSKIFK